MVRRRVASGKMSLAVGLRQCIRPLVESKTPGHDGHPLAFAPINWTVWLGPFPKAGSESVGSTHCHLSPRANREGTFLLNREFLGGHSENRSAIAFTLAQDGPGHSDYLIGQRYHDDILVFAS